ncbi:hypothetical protein [Actinokineospora enzanensis]|uniref:hypothetical protein n=1 Tax=Actinokineospora enzanensis TaxID=155975 RepID=UPI00036D8183|nr:hypothetical protein [Actinokineospora enzanensis]
MSKRTRRAVETGPTAAQRHLYEQARRRSVPGRSTMSEDQLGAAVARANTRGDALPCN